jgi:16S rRNA processing protein RimM
LLIVGRVGSPYGVKGWNHVASFTDPPEQILNYQPWHLTLSGKTQTVKITNSRKHGKSVVVQFTNCTDRDKAHMFTGAEIAIDAKQLPSLPSDEYYWTDLIGLTVITTQGQILGTIQQFLATGSNDVFVVTGDKRRLLPYLMNQVVLEIDLAKKIMRVDWDPEF